MIHNNPEFDYYKELLSGFQIFNEMVDNNYFHLKLLNSAIYEYHGNMPGIGMWHLEPVSPCMDYSSDSLMTDPDNTYANYQGERIYFKATADPDIFKPDVFFIGIEDIRIFDRLAPDIVKIKEALVASNATKERLLAEYMDSYEGALQHVKNLFGEINQSIIKILGSKYMNISPGMSFNGVCRCFVYIHVNNVDLVKIIANTKTFDIKITSENSETQQLLIESLKPLTDAAEKVRMHMMYSSLSGGNTTDGCSRL